MLIFVFVFPNSVLLKNKKPCKKKSDYSLAQFRFLQRLLIVHGRWNYRRVSMVILYSFYKNIMLVSTLFLSGAYNQFTGQSPYPSAMQTLWNGLSTSFPILFFGMFEQDISDKYAQKYPWSYKIGQERGEFNTQMVVMWVVNAFYHASVAYFFTFVILTNEGIAGILSKVFVFYYRPRAVLVVLNTINHIKIPICALHVRMCVCVASKWSKHVRCKQKHTGM